MIKTLLTKKDCSNESNMQSNGKLVIFRNVTSGELDNFLKENRIRFFVNKSNSYIQNDFKINITNLDMSSLVKEIEKLNVTKDDSVSNKDMYDSNGALIYIIFFLFIYGLIVVLVLLSKIKPTKNKYRDDDTNEKTSHLLAKMQELSVTKSILEQLKDQEYRDKLWSIYREDTTEKDDEIELKDEKIVRNIEKKIEILEKTELVKLNMNDLLNQGDSIDLASSFNDRKKKKNISFYLPN